MWYQVSYKPLAERRSGFGRNEGRNWARSTCVQGSVWVPVFPSLQWSLCLLLHTFPPPGPGLPRRHWFPELVKTHLLQAPPTVQLSKGGVWNLYFSKIWIRSVKWWGWCHCLGTLDALERRPGFQLCPAVWPWASWASHYPLPACFPICKMGPNLQPQGANQMRKCEQGECTGSCPGCLQNKGVGVSGLPASSVGTLRCGSRKTVLNGLLSLPAQKTLPCFLENN